MTGLDKPVADFLSEQKLVVQMIENISEFFLTWSPVFEQENRSYLTVSVGCTGGRHRSVFITERVLEKLGKKN